MKTITQTELAAWLGVSEASLSFYFSGARRPTQAKASHFENITGVNAIVFRHGSPAKIKKAILTAYRQYIDQQLQAA